MSDFESHFDLQDTTSDYPSGHPMRRWSDKDPEPLELREPEYDYIKGAPIWVEVLLTLAMSLGMLVAAFCIGYVLGAS